jgi:hypothetical protein
LIRARQKCQADSSTEAAMKPNKLVKDRKKTKPLPSPNPDSHPSEKDKEKEGVIMNFIQQTMGKLSSRRKTTSSSSSRKKV